MHIISFKSITTSRSSYYCSVLFMCAEGLEIAFEPRFDESESHSLDHWAVLAPAMSNLTESCNKPQCTSWVTGQRPVFVWGGGHLLLSTGFVQITSSKRAKHNAGVCTACSSTHQHLTTSETKKWALSLQQSRVWGRCSLDVSTFPSVNPNVTPEIKMTYIVLSMTKREGQAQRCVISCHPPV